jgi:folate-binding protein YgfZ
MDTDLTPDMPRLVRFTAKDIPAGEADAVSHGAVVSTSDTAVTAVTGNGAVQCIQGLVTNDVETAGPHGFIYGAVLTPKGMIIADLWVARAGAELMLYTPRNAIDPLAQVFKRTLPPRLARTIDRSSDLATLRLVGPESLRRASDAGVELPDPGHVAEGTLDGTDYTAGRPGLGQPFALQLVCDREEADHVLAMLDDAGIIRGSPKSLELARILAGWPLVGAEIGPKTLPQEVRFDDIDGVSHQKGCYTGQETVARVHFRGHANRWLSGLMWESVPSPTVSDVVHDGKTVGRVTSMAWLNRIDRYIGLGLIRREIEPGTALDAAGSRASAVPLPFVLE